MTEPLGFTEALLSRSPVTVRRRVLWGECDPAGVVYTPRFADYAISALDWFKREALDLKDRPHPSAVQIVYPMRAMSFDFIRSLAADDDFDMIAHVVEIGRSTFTMGIDAQRVDRPASVFKSRLTPVCVDQATGRSIALPSEIRSCLERYSAQHPA